MQEKIETVEETNKIESNKKIKEIRIIEKEEEKINQNKKVYAINIVLIIAILIGIFTYLFKVEGLDNINKLLKTVDYRWVTLGFVCLISMWLAESITLQMPLKNIYKNQKMTNSIKITMIGQLFNNLTPFASGGQLMQTYIMSKEGKRASDALSVLTMKFVITQTSLILFTLLVVVSQFNFFISIFKNLAWIGILGILINIIIVILFFLAGTKKEFVMKIARPIIRFFGKIHIGKIKFVKNSQAKIDKIEKSVDNYSKQFIIMKKEKKTLIVMALIGLIQNILYYAITYTVYRAFGNMGASFFQIITTQAFLMLIMTIFPTPGSGLGAEGGFLLLFGTIFKNGTINLSILFWRIYVFYMPIIIGTLFFIPAKNKTKLLGENNERNSIYRK